MTTTKWLAVTIVALGLAACGSEAAPVVETRPVEAPAPSVAEVAEAPAEVAAAPEAAPTEAEAAPTDPAAPAAPIPGEAPAH